MDLPGWSASSETGLDLRRLGAEVVEAFDREVGDCVTPDKLNVFLIRLSDFFLDLERKTNTTLQHQKYIARKKVFTMAIERTNGKPLEVLEPYRNKQYFPEQTKVLTGLAKDRMAREVKRHFGLLEASSMNGAQRLNRKDLAFVSQGDYVLHVSHLFCLEDRVSEADLQRFLSQLDVCDRRSLVGLLGTQKIAGKKFKDLIPFMQSCFPVHPDTKDFTSRNTHPASVLLQLCCGMIFHPGHANKGLTDSKSPFAFENFAMTLAFKYFEAEHYGKLGEFFEQAFVAQQPCYEAVVENLMNFDPASRGVEVLFHARPSWQAELTIKQNIDGMMAWVERELLADYARDNAINVGNLTLEGASEIEASLPFAMYLMNMEPSVHARLQGLVGHRIVNTDLGQVVHDDLVMGLALARRNPTRGSSTSM